jgi:hypothetical protein
MDLLSSVWPYAQTLRRESQRGTKKETNYVYYVYNFSGSENPRFLQMPNHVIPKDIQYTNNQESKSQQSVVMRAYNEPGQ